MFQTEIISNFDEFRSNTDGCQEKWNDLWTRSGSHTVMHQAQSIIHFGEAFGFAANFRIVVVSRDKRWLTAIPLLLKRNRLGRLEGNGVANEWIGVDVLLDDASEKCPQRFSFVNNGFNRLNLYKVNLHWIPLDSPATPLLVNAWQSQGRRVWTKPRFFVGKQLVPSDWESFWKHLSKNRRKKLNRAEKDLACSGDVSLEAVSSTNADVMGEALRSAMEIEHAGWKGEWKTSLLSHREVAQCMERNFLHWAEQSLARVYFLKAGGRRIAFDLGYLAHRVYTSIKISYLPEFIEHGPGQLLNARLLQHFSENRSADLIDCLGPVSEATRKWDHELKPTARISLSTDSLLSKLGIVALANLSSLVSSRLVQPSAICD